MHPKCGDDLNTPYKTPLPLELLTSRGKLNFVTFYHPPSSSIDDLQHYIAFVSTATTFHLSLILCGDFNVPNINWDLIVLTTSSPTAITLCNFTQNHSLTPLVCHPTHGSHILDLLMINVPDFISCISVGASLHGCDHDTMYFTLLGTYHSQVSQSRVLLKYKDVNLKCLNEAFSHFAWDVIDSNTEF